MPNHHAHSDPQANNEPQMVASVSPSPPIFNLRGLLKHWAGVQGFTLGVPELTISRGEKIALVGYSGSGKSTLLDILAMVLKPDSADTFELAVDPSRPLDVLAAWHRNDLDVLAHARMRHMGYVLQTGGLFPFLTVRRNIGLSCRGLGLPEGTAVDKVARRLNISRHLDKLPGQLSVGERQRVAIARAMAHEPSVVIADEPTASLDPFNAEKIMALFAGLADEFNVTLIVATHDWDRVAQLSFRQIKFDLRHEDHLGAVQVSACG
ncbi:MAG: ATP-binding cassette domain-containing protein [Desulfobacteraceae bacterium]|nr:ATP-binding cassette domain-containing protein [Desulfobacteraceae bacterium]